MPRGNTNRSSSRSKRVRIDPKAEEENNKTTDRVSPTSKAEQELERRIASRPMDMQTLMKHHGQLHLIARREHFNKKNILKRMEENNDYVPRSARNQFKLTCLKETAERAPQKITELQDQANQAIQAYQTAIKQVIIEGCKEDKKTLFAKYLKIAAQGMHDITKAQIASLGHSCDITQKLVNVFEHTDSDRLLDKLNCSLNAFYACYKEVHSIQTMPAPSNIPNVTEDLEDEERAAALEAHYNAMQLPVNQELPELLGYFEACFYHPWQKFLEQSDENERLLAIRKISNEAIIGTATDQTATVTDNEPPQDQPTLAATIAKEIEKATKPLLKKLNNQDRQLKQLARTGKTPPKNNQRGPKKSGASNKKKSDGKPKGRPKKTNNRGRSRSKSTSRKSRSRSRSNSTTSTRSGGRNTRGRGRSADGDNDSASGGSNNEWTNVDRPRRTNRSRRPSARNRRNSNTRTNRS